MTDYTPISHVADEDPFDIVRQNSAFHDYGNGYVDTEVANMVSILLPGGRGIAHVYWTPRRGTLDCMPEVKLKPISIWFLSAPRNLCISPKLGSCFPIVAILRTGGFRRSLCLALKEHQPGTNLMVKVDA